MELTTPGPLGEQLSLHEKQSTENSILREHLKFDYSNTLNGDKPLKTEVGDTPSSEKTLSKEAELSVEKGKEHNQFFSDPDLDHHSPNKSINENSSNIDGSLQDNRSAKTSSIKDDFHNEKPSQLLNNILKTNEGTSEDKEMCPSDVESSDISSNGPKEEISTTHQDEATNQNCNGHCLGLQPNASIKSSKEVSEIEISDLTSAEGSLKTDSSILINEVDGDEEIKPGTSNSRLDANTTSSHSIVQKDVLDKDIDLIDGNIVTECENKEQLPSKSNDWPDPLIPHNEEVPISTSTIVQSSVPLYGNERIEDNDNIEPELSKVHLNSDHLATTDQESLRPINNQNPNLKETDKHPSKESSTPPNSNSNDQPSASVPFSNPRQVPTMPPVIPPAQKTYDYLLKVLLVGDSDVGKQEIISDMEDGTTDSPFCSSAGAGFKTTIILIDGKRVKLQLWDTSGQGRFCTIIRSYSRGAQGILLVYDITNKWSFEGINRWLKEVDQHAPGIPKVLVGNRLHLAFKRQVHQEEAEEYAERNSMGFFEVSPLVNFNISETLVELARMALRRNGMERWNGRSNKVSTLYELCAHSIVNRTTVYGIDRLKLPTSVKQNLKSYAVTNYSISQTNKKFLRRPGSSSQYYASGSFKNRQSGGSPASSICNSLRRVHRTRQHTPLANTPADAANVNCGPSRKSCTIS